MANAGMGMGINIIKGINIGNNLGIGIGIAINLQQNKYVPVSFVVKQA